MRRQSLSRRGFLLAAGGLGLTACSTTIAGRAAPHTAPAPTTRATSTATQPASTSAAPTTPSSSPTPVDPASVKANEVGVIPVMMIHRVTADVTGAYDTTPADFRAGLQRLFKAGYRPISAFDLAQGKINIPAGMSPVVLTFDDGYTDQFGLRADGSVDPQTAAGIVLDVCRQFPHCPPAGTFYVNRKPFGLEDAAAQARGLKALVKLGFEIGNHTLDHANLGHLSAAEVEREIVMLQRIVQAAIGQPPRTLALPFGVAPTNDALAASGSWDGESYQEHAVMLVGANPSPSPFAAKYDPMGVPRIRSTSWNNGNVALTGKYWWDWLDAHPAQRYVSAGNPGHVTFPQALRGKLAPQFASRAIAY